MVLWTIFIEFVTITLPFLYKWEKIRDVLELFSINRYVLIFLPHRCSNIILKGIEGVQANQVHVCYILTEI